MSNAVVPKMTIWLISAGLHISKNMRQFSCTHYFWSQPKYLNSKLTLSGWNCQRKNNNRVCVCLSGCQQGRGGCRERASGAGGEAETRQEPRGQGHGLSLRKSQGSSGRGSPLTTQPRCTHRSAHTHSHTHARMKDAEINQLECHTFFKGAGIDFGLWFSQLYHPLTASFDFFYLSIFQV